MAYIRDQHLKGGYGTMSFDDSCYENARHDGNTSMWDDHECLVEMGHIQFYVKLEAKLLSELWSDVLPGLGVTK